MNLRLGRDSRGDSRDSLGLTVEEKSKEHLGGKAIEFDEWMDVGNE